MNSSILVCEYFSLCAVAVLFPSYSTPKQKLFTFARPRSLDVRSFIAKSQDGSVSTVDQLYVHFLMSIWINHSTVDDVYPSEKLWWEREYYSLLQICFWMPWTNANISHQLMIVLLNVQQSHYSWALGVGSERLLMMLILMPITLSYDHQRYWLSN